MKLVLSWYIYWSCSCSRSCTHAELGGCYICTWGYICSCSMMHAHTHAQVRTYIQTTISVVVFRCALQAVTNKVGFHNPVWLQSHLSASQHTRTHTHTARTHTHTHTHACTHTHTHVYTHTHTYTHTRAHMHAHIHTHTCAHTHKHTHTHTLGVAPCCLLLPQNGYWYSLGWSALWLVLLFIPVVILAVMFRNPLERPLSMKDHSKMSSRGIEWVQNGEPQCLFL